MTDNKPAPAGGAPKKKEPELNKYFRLAVKTRANDLHLKVGQPPKLRLQGSLKNTTGEVLTEERMEKLVFELLKPAQKEHFLEHGTLDFAYELDHENRFRTNVFRQRGVISIAARRVNSSIPSFESIHLPEVLSSIAESPDGLILVVGPTGSGKSTTIAAMIDHINSSRSCHIVTIEDPIEYLFIDKKALVSQREIGIDVKDFNEALIYMMRQDPDVVLVGEMRDMETVTAALRAAETGHLVFGTLHSANSAQSIHRMLDLFPQDERDLARQTLSLGLRAIVSQKLVPCIKEGVDRVPALEIMLANPSVKKLIAEERESDLMAVIKASTKEGMQDFTENLSRLILEGMIDPKEAFKIAPNREELKMALKGIKTSSSGIL